jgi:CPA1 family monovalent cation:H+ antiporter
MSPTDPVAVLSMIRGVPIPERLRIEVEGEALLNDGVGVVLFTLLLGFAVGDEQLTVGAVAWDFVREAGGGILVGLVGGYLAYRAIRRIDDFPIEVLITLALVTGCYALAQRIGASGPLATVAAGLLVGHRAPKDAMSEQTERYVSALWTLIDEVLNAMLFLLIGLEVFVLETSPPSLAIGLLAIPIAIFARWVAVAVPLLAPIKDRLNSRYVPFLTWAAVRGGISIALALSLPPGPPKPTIVAATYAVVLFSILVQGPTLASLARRLQLDSGGGQPR